MLGSLASVSSAPADCLQLCTAPQLPVPCACCVPCRGSFAPEGASSALRLVSCFWQKQLGPACIQRCMLGGFASVRRHERACRLPAAVHWSVCRRERACRLPRQLCTAPQLLPCLSASPVFGRHRGCPSLRQWEREGWGRCAPAASPLPHPAPSLRPRADKCGAHLRVGTVGAEWSVGGSW